MNNKISNAKDAALVQALEQRLELSRMLPSYIVQCWSQDSCDAALLVLLSEALTEIQNYYRGLPIKKFTRTNHHWEVMRTATIAFCVFYSISATDVMSDWRSCE